MLVVTEGTYIELADWLEVQLVVAALAKIGDHHHQSPEVEEIGAACRRRRQQPADQAAQGKVLERGHHEPPVRSTSSGRPGSPEHCPVKNTTSPIFANLACILECVLCVRYGFVTG